VPQVRNIACLRCLPEFVFTLTSGQLAFFQGASEAPDIKDGN
jgi:hypothetical protein